MNEYFFPDSSLFKQPHERNVRRKASNSLWGENVKRTKLLASVLGHILELVPRQVLCVLKGESLVLKLCVANEQ